VIASISLSGMLFKGSVFVGGFWSKNVKGPDFSGPQTMVCNMWLMVKAAELLGGQPEY